MCRRDLFKRVAMLLLAAAGVSDGAPPKKRSAPPAGPTYMVPFDALSMTLLSTINTYGSTITESKITWKARKSDGQIIWTVQVYATPTGTSGTFPIGTTLAQVKEWAAKWQACTNKPVTVVE